MKSTIQLQGERRAVVEIPYSKLIPQERAKETPHACCQSKIVLTGTSTRSSSKVDIRRMVQEMEEAYDRDVKTLQAKIGQLQRDKAADTAHWQRDRRQLQAEFTTRKVGFEKEIDSLRQDIKRKDGEIKKVHQERELLLRSKISEFRQVEYIDRLNELTHIIRLKDCQIKELSEKYEVVNRERLNIEQHSRNSKLKLEQQISRLSLQLSNTTNSLLNEQNAISYASRLKEQQSSKQIQQLKYQLQKVDSALREALLSNEAKDQQISSLSHKVKSLETTVSELESQIGQLKGSIQELTTLKHQLCQQVTVCRRTIAFLNEEKERLLLELDVRFRETDRLKIDLFEKERVYQVKIQRVIDSKQQIEQLQSTIFQLQQQITHLNQDKQFLGQDIAKLKAEIQSQAEARVKLQGEISGLKAYISKREGSFRWAVERQIEKDIIVTDERPQTYKVSQVGEYSRLKSAQVHTNKIISQQIGLQMQANLFGSYPQQIVLQKFHQ